MSEWIWLAAVGAAFGAGAWWGERRAVLRVARMIAADILRWGPNAPPREPTVRERPL